MHSISLPRATRRMIIGAPLLVLLVSVNVSAQSGRPPQGTPPSPQTVPIKRPTHDASSSRLQVELPTPVAETPVPLVGGGGRGEIQTLSFISPDANFERNLVKDAPFTADSLTEHVQTLGDSNRMVRKSTARLFRDGAGRTRREHTLTRGNTATLAPDGEPPRLIVINDPVGSVNYTIETQTGIARRQHLPPGLMEARQRALGTSSFSVLMPTSTAHRRMAKATMRRRPRHRRRNVWRRK